MKKISIVFTIATAVLFTACGGNADKNTENDEAQDAHLIESCTYTYAEGSAHVNWTAFKTTDRVGVPGVFDHVIVSSDEGEDVAAVLQTITFEIDPSSVNTQDGERDAKIVSAFFGIMNNPGVISGEIVSVDGDNNNGSASVSLTMNEVTQEVVLNYTLDGNNITLSGIIDMVNFDGDAMVESLNEACHDLHKGADGVSMTWSEVELEIVADFIKDCE